MEALRKAASQIGGGSFGPPPGVAEAALRAWVKGELTQEEYFQTVQVNVGETADTFQPRTYPPASPDLVSYVRIRSRGDGSRDQVKNRILGAWLHAARRILADNNQDETLLVWALPTCQQAGLAKHARRIQDALARYSRVRPPEWFEAAHGAQQVDMEAKRREGGT
jgi:hypothetical protein